MNDSIHILKPHVAVNVRNVEESIAFYSKMFAAIPVKVRPGYAKFDLHLGNPWEAFVVLEDNLAESSTCCGSADSPLVTIDSKIDR
jgi:catechol 2,3-dioxygenase-like lactoylglutathione lyase family enzyme